MGTTIQESDQAWRSAGRRYLFGASLCGALAAALCGAGALQQQAWPSYITWPAILFGSSAFILAELGLILIVKHINGARCCRRSGRPGRLPLTLPETAPLLGAASTPSPLVHERIAAQALRTPSAIAVRCDDGAETLTITYGQLLRNVDALAEAIRAAVGPSPAEQPLVAINTERSISMVVGAVGIMRAGAAYVPIDPKYPLERQKYILDDARVYTTAEPAPPLAGGGAAPAPSKALLGLLQCALGSTSALASCSRARRVLF